ncbi:MAG: hypothetical protein N2C12_09400 [Planctomycetales bacterium]
MDRLDGSSDITRDGKDIHHYDAARFIPLALPQRRLTNHWSAHD